MIARLLIGASLVAIAAPSSAASILYRVDHVVGTDVMDAALVSSGHTITKIATDLSGQTLASYDIVIYANQNLSQADGDQAALDAYMASGGKLIYANWRTSAAGELPAINSAYTGGINQVGITLSQFASGVTNPLTAVNPGWGVFTTGLTALAGGTVAAMFDNGDAAIVIGTDGRSIHNGFLTDTVDSQQLYLNEIDFLLSGAVPEPATWAMMISGFAMAGFAARRRTKAAVSYA
jgi:hypothetical protein